MKNAKKSKKRKNPLYSVEVFYDEKEFPILSKHYGEVWGGTSDARSFKEAKRLYKEMCQTFPNCSYRIISTNGFVRMKSK